MDRSIPIRSLSRGIAVLQAINRFGSLTMTEIGRTCDLPFPTVSRLVQTLIHEGLIEREPQRRRYRPTALVQTLSHGFEGDARLVQCVRGHIVELTRNLGWPVTFSTPVGHSMVIRDSTHSLSALTFNEYYPGYASPLLESAAGLVVLAALPEEERESLLHSMKLLPNEAWRQIVDRIETTDLLETIRRDGYAARSYNRFTRNPGKTSSIATPLFEKGRVVGAISLAYFVSALKGPEAVARFVAPLRETAAAISRDLSD